MYKKYTLFVTVLKNNKIFEKYWQSHTYARDSRNCLLCRGTFFRRKTRSYERVWLIIIIVSLSSLNPFMYRFNWRNFSFNLIHKTLKKGILRHWKIRCLNIVSSNEILGFNVKFWPHTFLPLDETFLLTSLYVLIIKNDSDFFDGKFFPIWRFTLFLIITSYINYRSSFIKDNSFRCSLTVSFIKPKLNFDDR